MCGIYAEISHDPLGTDPIAVAASMSDRGPDGSGWWRSQDGTVLLVHTRLAIRGGSNGKQPIISEDGSVVAIVNGELYGHQYVRSELEKLGHSFRTDSDSEIVVHLYEEYGDEFLNMLRGEFALVLWDEKKKRLVAARDRFGVKPLVSTRDFASGTFKFASNVKALKASGHEMRWDVGTLARCIAVQYPGPGQTIFRGVFSVPGGAMVECGIGPDISDSYGRVKRWWRAVMPMRMEHSGPSGGALAAALTGAVRDRLESDVPVAIALSGGIDSACIALEAARLGAHPECFTVSFPGHPWDESGTAREVAESLGLGIHVVEATDAALAEALVPSVMGSEGLCVNLHLPAKRLLFSAIRASGASVVLTGEGADELLAGYHHLRADGGLDTTPDAASMGVMVPDGRPEIPGVREWFQDRYWFCPSWIAAKSANGMAAVPFLRTYTAVSKITNQGASHAKSMCTGLLPRGNGDMGISTEMWIASALESYILKVLGDGTEMPCSVEGRTPFLDHKVYEVARRMPMASLVSGTRDKIILRDGIGGSLPASVRHASKKPFVLPRAGSLVTSKILEILSDPACSNLPMFDPRKLISGVLHETVPETVILTAVSAAILHVGMGLG